MFYYTPNQGIALKQKGNSLQQTFLLKAADTVCVYQLFAGCVHIQNRDVVKLHQWQGDHDLTQHNSLLRKIQILTSAGMDSNMCLERRAYRKADGL